MTTPPSQPSPPPAPVEVYALTSRDQQARDHKIAAIDAAQRAAQAMEFDMLPLARQRLTEALGHLDALEARLGQQHEAAPSAADYAARHPVACMHADEDGEGSHILEPGEKCQRKGRR